ncbi:class I SAM-dependent methyltransferase [Arthrobacter pityocampae]|uniref:Class I SAM-dependent methyltransferase n=1 Tax=Arthrobacter pityocampae TaxID=547334 RepID=A0A2S5IZ37_9MICC|nr:class I SAM-dependent methyltransferase [Arthrobacter pityocampae]PPB49866.1 class I SAM-dependent methyltransferase [Arthrobacter pityocampae]
MNDYDQRLVDLYDQDNPDGPDHAFYRALADDVSAHSVLDLGCGTGILTVTFPGDGRDVVGIDPSPAMLAYAQRRPGAEDVEWILGDSSTIPRDGFDYAVMTGNVAQHIPGGQWERTLLNLRQSLTKGGTLAFESRNPAARAWDGWAAQGRTTRDTPHGPLTEWQDVSETAPGIIELTFHNRFAETGDTVTESLVLTFRSRQLLQEQLHRAGFEIDATYGDWDRTPFTDTSPLIVLVARAR